MKNEDDTRTVRETDTYNETVGAGDGRATARAARTHAHDANGAAGETEKDIQVREVDANRHEQGGTSSRVGLFDILVCLEDI